MTTDPRRRARQARLRVRRVVLARRRPLAALLTGAAVLVGLHAARPPTPASVPLSVASHDLGAGTALVAADLVTVRVPAALVPDDTARDPVGRTLAGPVRRGEPITDVRLVGPQLVTGHPELTAVPVRLPDAAMAALLRIGDRVDLIATDPQGGPATTVAHDALVLALPSDTAEPSGQGLGSAGLSGRLVVVGVAGTEVAGLAAAGVRAFLTFAFAPDP